MALPSVDGFEDAEGADGAALPVEAGLAGGPDGTERVASGPMPRPEALDLGRRPARALAAAHEAGVLHRDLEPENVLLSAWGEPKLVDSGIARIEGGHETASGVVTASVAYAPPEVLGGQRPDQRSDVHSLAATLYTLIAGSPAFARDTDEGNTSIIARVAAEDPLALRPAVPDELERALAMAMAEDPADRPPTAEAFASLLDAVSTEAGGNGPAAAVPAGDAAVATFAGTGPSAPPADTSPAAPPPGAPVAPGCTRRADRPAWLLPAALGAAAGPEEPGTVAVVLSGGDDDPSASPASAVDDTAVVGPSGDLRIDLGVGAVRSGRAVVLVTHYGVPPVVGGPDTLLYDTVETRLEAR